MIGWMTASGSSRCAARAGLLGLAVLTLALLAPATAQPAADNDRPGPYVFIYGLQGAGAAETARSLGCNTLYLDLPTDAPLKIEPTRALIAEAAREGLHVIVGLRTKLAGEYRISAWDAAYAGAVREWIRAVVGGLQGTAGISAWATDHYLERDLSHTEADFRQFLLGRYGSLAALNQSWGTHYARIDEVTRVRADALDQDQVYGVGRPSVDLAEYQRQAFHDVMRLWADEIRAIDAETPLFTGRISLYRSLTAIPDLYDVVQPFMPPDILEPDIATANVQAVQMARRGGRFDVLPWLRIPLPPSRAYSYAALYGWVLEAGLRGAVGVGLEEWERISALTSARNNAVDQLAAALAQAPFAGDAPRPSVAVLYEPYAAGHQFAGTPAYGFLTDYAVDDLASLACAYRPGTIFGGLDYLCLSDLAQVELDRYSAILAPACLSIPPEAAARLGGYVEGGGALFADLGLGMYQSHSWDPTLSPLGAILGISESRDLEDRFGGFKVGETHPAFPSVRVGMEAEGTFVPGEGVNLSLGRFTRRSFEGAATQMEGYAFKGPSWFVHPRAGAIPLATQSVRFDDRQRPYFLGLTVVEVGVGLAVFAPFPAWSYWPPQDALHAAVHCDLFSRRARYRLISDALVDYRVGLSGSDDWLHLSGRGDVATVEVLAGVADHRAFLGAVSTFSAAGRTAAGLRSGVVRLTVDLPEGSMRHCEAIPVRVRPASGEAHARVSVYGPGLVALELGGDGAAWGRERRTGPEGFYGGRETRIRLNIDDGLYPVEPGSRHEVSLVEGRDSTQTMLVTADHRGRLDFWLTTAGGRLQVSPAPDDAGG